MGSKACVDCWLLFVEVPVAGNAEFRINDFDGTAGANSPGVTGCSKNVSVSKKELSE